MFRERAAVSLASHSIALKVLLFHLYFSWRKVDIFSLDVYFWTVSCIFE